MISYFLSKIGQNKEKYKAVPTDSNHFYFPCCPDMGIISGQAFSTS